jgi:hypothetical protein
MKRLILVLVVLALMMAVMAAPAGADGDNEVVGSWVAIDAEGSFWQMAVSASGRINSIDSGTFPCEGYRTHLWGELEAIAENLFVFSSLDLRCLAGPYKGSEGRCRASKGSRFLPSTHTGAPCGPGGAAGTAPVDRGLL